MTPIKTRLADATWSELKAARGQPREIDSDASIPVDGTEMPGLMLRGKFSEDHAIARGISDRGGLHVV